MLLTRVSSALLAEAAGREMGGVCLVVSVWSGRRVSQLLRLLRLLQLLLFRLVCTLTRSSMQRSSDGVAILPVVTRHLLFAWWKISLPLKTRVQALSRMRWYTVIWRFHSV